MSLDPIKQKKLAIFWILGIISIPLTIFLVDKVIFSIETLFTLEIHGEYGIFIYLVSIIFALIMGGAIINLIRVFKPEFLRIIKPKPRLILKKLEAITIICIFGFIFVLSGIGINNSIKTAKYLEDQSKPPWLLWSNDPSNSIRICWETQSPIDSNLKWGTSPENLVNSVNGFSNKVHLIDLSDLTANTTYYFQVDGFTKIYNFTTAPSNPTQFRFIKVGDSQYGTTTVTDRYEGGGSPKVIKQIQDQYFQNNIPDFDFFVGSGDQVDRGTADHFKRYFADWEWAMNRGVPWIAASGNHESYFDPDINHYHQYFNYTGVRSMPGAPENYWVSYGNMIIINVLISYSGAFLYDFEPRTGVLEWLESILSSQASNYEWVVINQHHPIYVSSWYPGDYNELGYDPILVEKELPLIEKYGVDLMLSGHWHSFERLTKGNCTFIMNGAGGGTLDGWGNPQTSTISDLNAESQASNYDTFSYSVFDVNGSQMNIKTIAINGTVLDSTTIYS